MYPYVKGKIDINNKNNSDSASSAGWHLAWNGEKTAVRNIAERNLGIRNCS